MCIRDRKGGTPAAAAASTDAGVGPEEPGGVTLDEREVLARLGHDKGLVREIATIYREKSPAWRVEIERALAARDGPALARAAHSLKGAVANFGAEPATLAAAALEEAARTGAGEAPERWRALLRELDRFEQALAALTDRLA